MDREEYKVMAKAMFGAGCFWGVEYNFSKIKGVNEVMSGYSGGKTPNPTYEMVCNNNTEHAEVVLVDFNEEEVTYEELLDAFWKKHDPTTLNRQGPDIGSQYRSAIFYYNDEQKEVAKESLRNLQKKLDREIVTEITKVQTFWKAEEYHQKYFEKHSRH
jgi:peptide-methionine (S)-S-oxide reductase